MGPVQVQGGLNFAVMATNAGVVILAVIYLWSGDVGRRAWARRLLSLLLRR
jgi:hypothetical protein